MSAPRGGAIVVDVGRIFLRCEAFNLEPPCSPWLGDLPTNAVADDAEESSVSSDEEDDE